jgi:hypothetical protein
VRGSSTFLNASDAAILSISIDEPHWVEATVVRNGVVTTLRTTDRESVEKARAVAESAPFAPVLSDMTRDKFVNIERVTDIVLEPIAPQGAQKRGRKLVLTLKYVPPGNPFQPQAMACGEIHERNMIATVLSRLGYPKHHHEEEEVEAVVVVEEVEAAPRAKRRARA